MKSSHNVTGGTLRNPDNEQLSPAKLALLVALIVGLVILVAWALAVTPVILQDFIHGRDVVSALGADLTARG